MAEEITKYSSNPFTARFDDFFSGKYKKNVERVALNYPESRSIEIDFKEIEKYDYKLADELLVNPDIVIKAAEHAASARDLPTLELTEFKPYVRFYNLPDENKLLIRDISSDHLGKIVQIEGIVRQITDVLPKLSIAVWQCRRCENTYKVLQEGREMEQPPVCEACKHKDFKLIAEESRFTDYQKIQVQEPLEQSKGGEQAKHLDIYVYGDLVNKVFPGKRVELTGIPRLIPPKKKDTIYGRYLEANYLLESDKEFEDIKIYKEDEEKIRELASNPGVYDLLVKSIAPVIYGHENIKEAIALQLFGGCTKDLPGKSRVRGNIHVLLVGDPGTGKSMMLQAVDKIAPKSIYVGGKTATGTGLTATAEKDEFGEGGWTIKAGALVLASGGVALVDEFDKMNPEERSAMHEALEQGSIGIAKAGIVARFKTDTSVLAAANPKMSRFDSFTPLLEQINLPASLLSRFDLFFMIRDVLDKKRDEEIARHVLRTHKAGETMLRYGKGLEHDKTEAEKAEKEIEAPISQELLLKYISFARQRIWPVMTNEAMEKIIVFYTGLRAQGNKGGDESVYTATHRQLEGLIRLSEASARVKLKDHVEEEDVDRAIKLFQASMQEFGIDPATGLFDVDIIQSGQSHTQKTGMKKIMKMIKEKAATQESVSIEDIVEEAKGFGLDSVQTKEAIDKLKKQGELYEPRNGHIRPTTKD